MSNVLNIYAKLAKARVMLQEVEMTKSGHNKFAGYNYFTLADMLPAINRICQSLGMLGVISYGEKEATLSIYNAEKDEPPILINSPRADASLKGCHPIQNLGAEETYLRRYLWVTAFEIVEHESLDSSEPLKPRGLKHKPTDGARESVTAARRESLERQAQDLTTLLADGDVSGAYGIYMAVTDSDEKVCLWTYLDSKTRRAIKAHGETLKEQQQ